MGRLLLAVQMWMKYRGPVRDIWRAAKLIREMRKMGVKVTIHPTGKDKGDFTTTTEKIDG